MTKCGVEISVQNVNAQDYGIELIGKYVCYEETEDGVRVTVYSTVECDKLGSYNCAYCGKEYKTITCLKVHEEKCESKTLENARIMAQMCDYAYDGPDSDLAPRGWVNDSGSSIWQNVKFEDDCGVKSVMYARMLCGILVSEYVYAYAGTDGLTAVNDWVNNFSQALLGIACQYADAVRNSEIVTRIANSLNIPISFTGHSLGGGLASASALRTGNSAYTFNAAGLSDATKTNYNLTAKAHINAYIVDGEVLNSTLNSLGQNTAEGSVHTISSSATSSYDKHDMSAVYEGLR